MGEGCGGSSDRKHVGRTYQISAPGISGSIHRRAVTDSNERVNIVFMRHSWMTKGMRPRDLSGSIGNGFRQLGVRTVSSGDGWLLGDQGDGLVVCQVMGISDRQCHVMIVAASGTQQGVGICDRLTSFIKALGSFDDG